MKLLDMQQPYACLIKKEWNIMNKKYVIKIKDKGIVFIQTENYVWYVENGYKVFDTLDYAAKYLYLEKKDKDRKTTIEQAKIIIMQIANKSAQ